MHHTQRLFSKRFCFQRKQEETKEEKIDLNCWCCCGSNYWVAFLRTKCQSHLSLESSQLKWNFENMVRIHHKNEINSCFRLLHFSLYVRSFFSFFFLNLPLLSCFRCCGAWKQKRWSKFLNELFFLFFLVPFIVLL